MKLFPYIVQIVLIGMIAACNSSDSSRPANSKADGSLPNIVVVYCDDLGYGDLACFGNTMIRTPNIDRMAAEGMKFSEFYSASPVCSPSRAALLTGRIPQRMGINHTFSSSSFTGMPVEEITTADLLKSKGYTTGIVGKWHLGHRHEFLPLQRGFDEYFGVPTSSGDVSIVYMDGNKVVDFHVDLHFITQTYTEKAIDFIDRHKEGPFYLYLAHNMPHRPIYASPDFDGRSGKGLYADVIEEIDWSVGQLLNKLEEDGILNNTLVIFSSDNGPCLAYHELGGSAGILREGKHYTFEGGQRVPTLALWPEVITAGTEYNDMALMMDWFPTFAEIAGADTPPGRAYDGQSILQVLKGTGTRTGKEFLYFDALDLQCYRNGDWKLKLPYKGFHGNIGKRAVAPHDTLLFNLKSDPGERVNLCKEEPDKVEEMLALMEAYKDSKGELPPSLVTSTPADNADLEYFREKYGTDYPVEW